ncbi:hypothetical protein BHYA_0408g00020 [Botrytis hyacinthi]|uniref:Uncharacterized protein n=1 Tax=Botrytis hyacinthi TaxID=278943 RepID=A0A4Z1G8P3_9HELO|nr:hypothetical protein BHYA_0408g00020 [Botrytis hyacinthi]
MTNQNYPDLTTVNSPVDSSQTQMQAMAKTVSADPVPVFENAIHIGGSTAGSTVNAQIGGDDNNMKYDVKFKTGRTMRNHLLLVNSLSEALSTRPTSDSSSTRNLSQLDYSHL